MAVTYEPIASTTLGSDAADFTFSSISGSFTDLILICSANNDTATVFGLRLRVNSDSGSNYSATYIYGDGTSAVSERLTSQTSMAIGNTSAVSTSPTTGIVQIMSYANTNVHKTVLSAHARATGVVSRNVNLWRSTSAITSLTLFSSTGNLKTGTTFSLYGIKAA